MVMVNQKLFFLQFKDIASQFVAVSKQFSTLSQCMFDADPMFLSYIQLYP